MNCDFEYVSLVTDMYEYDGSIESKEWSWLAAGTAISNEPDSYNDVATGFPVLGIAAAQMERLSFLSYGGFMAGWAAPTTAPLK